MMGVSRPCPWLASRVCKHPLCAGVLPEACLEPAHGRRPVPAVQSLCTDNARWCSRAGNVFDTDLFGSCARCASIALTVRHTGSLRSSTMAATPDPALGHAWPPSRTRTSEPRTTWHGVAQCAVPVRTPFAGHFAGVCRPVFLSPWHPSASRARTRPLPRRPPRPPLPESERARAPASRYMPREAAVLASRHTRASDASSSDRRWNARCRPHLGQACVCVCRHRSLSIGIAFCV